MDQDNKNPNNLTEAELNGAKAVITRIENGLPIRLDSLLELMRALGCLGNLQVLLPEDEPTASEMLRGKKTRMRVRHSEQENTKKGDWKWGDEV